MATQTLPKLFALLVGVNNYESESIRDLKGCLADVERMKAYLEEPFVKRKFTSKPSITVLTNSAATKKGVISAFEEKLSKASAGDSVFFYFSGHGAREQTNIATFKEDEFDGHLASIICQDSDPFAHADPKFAAISDKELRFLIHRLESKTGAKIVCVFDCCHSGENTRSLKNKIDPDDNTRIISRETLSARNDKGFYFGGQEKTIFKAINEGKNLQSILPEGRHIQLAACREVELAVEFPADAEIRKGIFTTALLDVLAQFKGEINYDDLHLRVLNRMSTYSQSEDAQTPQIYIKTDDPNERYRTFLTHEPSDKSLTCNVVLGGQEAVEKEWRITAGALQAIPLDKKKWPATLKVKSTKHPESTFTAKILEVLPAYSLIKFKGKQPPEDDATLYTEIKGLGTDPIKVCVTGPDKKGVAFVKKELQAKLKKAERKHYQLTDTEDEAQYSLVVNQGILLTTPPFKHDKPVIKGISLKEGESKFLGHKVGIANEDLIQMGSWHFLKKLEYSENHDLSGLVDQDKTMFPIELLMYVYDEKSNEERRLFPDKRKTFTFDLSPQDTSRDFRLEVRNHSEEDYYCSLLFLTNIYEVNAQIMSSPQMLLGPEQEVLSSKGRSKPNGKKYIRMSLDDEAYIKEFNLDGISYYFKLIVSKTPFDVEKLQMKALPKPMMPEALKSVSASKSRGSSSAFSWEPDMPSIEWEIHTFELRIVSPF